MAVLQMVPSDKPEFDYFDGFWTLFWRRECKKDALKAWAKIDPNLYPKILTAVASWRPIFLARENTRFTPLAASWLNGERWDDEIPPEYSLPLLSHAPTEIRDLPRKAGEIPQHVLDMIAKLKSRNA